MKLQIKRSTTPEKVFLSGHNYVYSCSVRLLASDEEKKLWEKYNASKEKLINVSGGESTKGGFLEALLRITDPTKKEFYDALEKEFVNHVIEGRSNMHFSFNDLLKGHTWKAYRLYTSFTEIPSVIAKELNRLHGVLMARENWDGRDEVLDLDEE